MIHAKFDIYDHAKFDIYDTTDEIYLHKIRKTLRNTI